MALKVEYETEFGITCDYAYCIIDEAYMLKKIESGENSFFVKYKGKVYASDDAYEQDATAISQFSYALELDTSNTKSQYNILKQCYLHLKTQDGFADAIDC
tara:strand:+ start:62 stop:364 length:303 start_codon:yes stop_codon:yes gene_type:complete